MMYAITAFAGVIVGVLISYISRNESKLVKRANTSAEYKHTKSEDEILQEKKIAEQWENLLSYSGGEK